MAHPLEDKFNAPAIDILDAITLGFRTQVDVKGKLAELYLLRKLEYLKKIGEIQDFIRQDEDGEPDFIVYHNSNPYLLEVKNLRNGDAGIYWKPYKAYKVEVQRTRNSKDGSNTRHYKRDYFDILSVCTFNQTGKWEYYFIKSSDLQTQKDQPEYLEIMQRVPITPILPWVTELKDILINYN